MSVTINGTTGITTPALTSTDQATIDGLSVGQGAGNVSTNTALGASALSSNSTGTRNTAVGSTAGSGVTGSRNTILGDNTLATSTSGNDNVAIGDYTMRAYTGSSSTAVGAQAMGNGTSNSGDNNTAIGAGAMNANASGASNTAVGSSALTSNTTASNNTAVGYQAGYSSTTATRNTLIGQIAGYALTTGGANVVIGDNALKTGTTAENCVAVGTYALSAATGIYNTAVGAGAGDAITTGAKNTILGRYNGNQGSLDIRTANNWIVLSDGDGNPRLYWDGTNSRWRAPSGQFQIQYAYDTTSGSAANVIVGSDGAMFRSTSALKYKQDIRDLESIDIGLFRPVRYKSKSQVDDPTKDHIGIIADEVHDAGVTELVTYGPDGEVEGFQYERLTVVLLKAVQDLKEKVEAQAAEIAALKGQ